MRRHTDEHHGGQWHEEKGHADALHETRFDQVPKIVIGSITALPEARNGEHDEAEGRQLT